MKCINCSQGNLIPSFIDDAFRAHTCGSCGGNWILVEDFVSWKDRHPEHRFNPEVTCEDDAADNRKALICPMSGQLMRKLRISAQHAHRLDYSNSVGGIWLDKGEWELLKAEGLAGSLNAIVTQTWQNKIRQETALNNFVEIYESKFGKETYKKAKEIRQWLQSHPQKADLRAYLLAEDPYSAEK